MSQHNDIHLILWRAGVQGSVKSYSPSDMCASPARDYKYAPLILHDVVLSGLVCFCPALASISLHASRALVGDIPGEGCSPLATSGPAVDCRSHMCTSYARMPL